MSALSNFTLKTLTKKQLELEGSRLIAESFGKSLKWQRSKDYRETHYSGFSRESIEDDWADSWAPESTNPHINWLIETGQPIGDFDGDDVEYVKTFAGEDYKDLVLLFTNVQRKFLSVLSGGTRYTFQMYGNNAGDYSRSHEKNTINNMIVKVEKAKANGANIHQMMTVAMEYLAKYDNRDKSVVEHAQAEVLISKLCKKPA